MLKKWEGAGDDEHRDGEALRIGDRLLVSAEARANAFAHQYATVSRQVTNPKLDRAARKRLSQLDRHTCTECRNGRTGCCSDFTEEELAQAIQKTQLRKSPGPDDITPEMLKHLGPVAGSALLHLINQSWNSGVVPQEWRSATVVPIPKASKDKRLLSSYRPIALTSCVGKLAERMLLPRLEFLVEERRLIPPRTSGLQSGTVGRGQYRATCARRARRMAEAKKRQTLKTSRWRGGTEVPPYSLRLQQSVRCRGPQATAAEAPRERPPSLPCPMGMGLAT